MLYNIGNAIVVSIINYEYIFAQIVNIILVDNKPLFIVKLLTIEYYSVHYHAYIITTGNIYKILNYEQFLDNYPLSIYNLDSIGDLITIITIQVLK